MVTSPAPLSERARAARLLVAITVHFDPARLRFLAEILRSLAEFPVAALRSAVAGPMPFER
jgi:hypothetical protein